MTRLATSIQTFLAVFTFVGLLPTRTASSGGYILSTLYTFRDLGCDGQTLLIQCPKGSAISVLQAQYGRQVPSDQTCPYRRQHLNSFAQEDTDCVAESSKQVLLDLCQDKKQCQITASTAVFGEDPCPHTGKYLQVRYKCRPNEFRHKVACEGDVLHLRCQKGLRLAIYSAAFGRTRGEATECPGFPSVVTDCQSPNSLKEVLKKCHGKRHCAMHATPKIFGSPCEPETSQYLKIIYSCVPNQILKKLNKKQRHSNVQNEDTRSSNTFSEYRDGTKIDSPGADGAPSYDPKSSTFDYENYLTVATQTTPSAGQENQQKPAVGEVLGSSNSSKSSTTNGSNTNYAVFCNYTIGPSIQEKEIGFVADWVTSLQFLHKNQEKAILYLIVGGCVGLILVLILIIGRLAYTKHNKKKQKLDVSEHVASSTPARNENGVDPSETIDMLQFNVHGTLRNNNTIDRRFSNYYS